MVDDMPMDVETVGQRLRAAREANFARKQAEAVKRQERVAKRLAEREKAAAAKAARAAAAAGAPPPPIGDN